MANRELMQEIKKLEQTLPSGVNYTKIDDCKIEERWECPIGLDLMVEPVIASDGATYDKKNFEEYIATRTAAKQSLLSPTTGLVLPAGALYFPANNISSEINTLLETKLTELKKLVAIVKENEKKLHALVQQGLAHRNKKEYIQAIACFKEAAEQEHAGGWYGLAMMHKDGLGVDKNPEEAEVLFNKVRSSAEKGNVFALYYLGQICEREIRSDYKKIPGYYRQAAENGIVEAMYALGHLHCDIFNTQYGLRYRDREEIIKWLTLAANAGHAEAQYELAEIYELGDDGKYACGPVIPKNDELARHYFSLAANQGHPYANQNLERMRKKSATLESSVAPISSSSSSSSSATPPPQPSAPPLALLNLNGGNSISVSITPTLDANTLINQGFKFEEQRNFEKAIECFQNAAQLQQPEGWYFLGQMYAIGLGIEKDPKRAYYYYRLAAEAGVDKAQIKLTQMNQEFKCHTPSSSKRKTNVPPVTLPMSSSSSSSSSSTPSVVLQPAFFTPSVRDSVKEDPEDIFIQGCKRLSAGRFDSAKKYFEAAAKEKHPRACRLLAKMYEDKNIQLKDDEERQLYIQHWYREAALLGDTGAAYRMGKIHANGEYRLGDIYINGKHISFNPKNHLESVGWYRRAGSEHAEAQYELGLYYEDYRCYRNGDSYNYYQNAANLGSQKAYDALFRLSETLIGELREYAKSKQAKNTSNLLVSSDDKARVDFARILIKKLCGNASDKKFSPEEVALISSSQGLNTILSKHQYAWVAEKLKDEWILQPQPPQAQSNAQSTSASRMSNGR